MTRENKVTMRQARKRLVQKERLRATKAQTHRAAQRWYDACQALATPGAADGQLALGEVIVNVSAPAEGQKMLVRWHNGTITTLWIGIDKIQNFATAGLAVGSYVVAATAWSETRDEPWLEERLMYASELRDVISSSDIRDYEMFWSASRELDELELGEMLMVAPVDEPPRVTSRGPGPRFQTPPESPQPVTAPAPEIEIG